MASVVPVMESVMKHGKEAISNKNVTATQRYTDRGSPHVIRLEPIANVLTQASRSLPANFEGKDSDRLMEEAEGVVQSAPEPGNCSADDSPSSSDNGESKKQLGRANRDPMSHRIIEKRRRDRMNNCLTNLSKLIPSAYLKKGRGRIEKTEIIEMAIRYMKHMQEERKKLTPGIAFMSQEFMKDKAIGTDEFTLHSQSSNNVTASNFRLMAERYKQGFYDCIAETLRFLALSEGLMINENSKTKLLFHLKDYFSRLTYDLLNSSTQYSATSILSLPWNQQKQISKFQLGYDSCASSPSPNKDDEPINMSLNKRDHP